MKPHALCVNQLKILFFFEKKQNNQKKNQQTNLQKLPLRNAAMIFGGSLINDNLS